MLFTTSILTSLLAAGASASVLPARQPPPVWESPFTGAIDAPVENQAMAFGVEFPFSYTVSDWCEPAFAPFTVYLTTGAAPPTFANVTSTGALADGIAAFEFGKFVVSRFGKCFLGRLSLLLVCMLTIVCRSSSAGSASTG